MPAVRAGEQSVDLTAQRRRRDLYRRALSDSGDDRFAHRFGIIKLKRPVGSQVSTSWQR